MSDTNPYHSETTLSFNGLPSLSSPSHEPGQLSVGERLKQARVNCGLTLNDIGQKLKLSSRQIEALEANDWAKLPGPTFIRGFVRNYARIVNIPADPLLSSLKLVVGTSTPKLDRPSSTTAVLPNVGHTSKKNYALILSGIILVSVTAIAYLYIPSGFWENTPTSPAAAITDTSLTPVTEAPAPIIPPTAPETPDVTAPINLAASNTILTAERHRLQFTFSEAAWVEVSDQTGQTIFSQLNPAGTQRDIYGLPPFNIKVGNAKHVRLQYKGRDIDLQPRSKDDIVRLNLE